MKKLLISFIAVFFCMTASAQEAGKMRFGVTAGMNLSSANLKLSHSRKIGFQAGIIGEYNISENIFINAMARYSMRGVKDVDIQIGKLEWNPGYVEIPVHFGFRWTFTETFKVFAEAGPYVAYAVSGKIKANDGSDAGLFSDEATAVLGGKYNKFEAGLGVNVGVEYSGFQLKVGYDAALTKIADVSDSAKNNNISVSLAYLF
jgi:hypothetical protein